MSRRRSLTLVALGAAAAAALALWLWRGVILGKVAAAAVRRATGLECSIGSLRGGAAREVRLGRPGGPGVSLDRVEFSLAGGRPAALRMRDGRAVLRLPGREPLALAGLDLDASGLASPETCTLELAGRCADLNPLLEAEYGVRFERGRFELRAGPPSAPGRPRPVRVVLRDFLARTTDGQAEVRGRLSQAEARVSGPLEDLEIDARDLEALLPARPKGNPRRPATP